MVMSPILSCFMAVRPPFCGSVTGEFSTDKPRASCSAMRFGFPCPPPQIEQKCCLANASSTRGQVLNKKLKYTAAAIVVLAAAIYINNTNRLAAHRDGKPVLLAHRGIAQRFDERELKNDTCTAARMLPSSHEYLENTISSMRAGFAAGADIVELDVHPTTDGEFAVFHDWTLDCRTDGHGVPVPESEPPAHPRTRVEHPTHGLPVELPAQIQQPGTLGSHVLAHFAEARGHSLWTRRPIWYKPSSL